MGKWTKGADAATPSSGGGKWTKPYEPGEGKWTDEDIRRAILNNKNTSEAEKRAQLRALEHKRSYVPVGKAAESMGAGAVDSAMTGATWGGWDEAAGAILPHMMPEGVHMSSEAATDRVRNEMDEYNHNHPWRALAGEIGGNIASVAGGATAMPKAATAMGKLAGNTLGRRAVVGGAVGGASAATYGFGEGEGGVGNRLESAAKAAPIGGGLGFLAPIASYGLGKGIGAAAGGVKKGIDRARGRKSMLPSRVAKSLLDDLDETGKTAGDIARKNKGALPDTMVGDLDDVFRDNMEAIRHSGQPGGKKIAKALRDRAANKKVRAKDIYDATVGDLPDLKVYLDDMTKKAKAVHDPLYKEARTTARPVDASGLVGKLKKEIAGLEGLKSGLKASGAEDDAGWILRHIANGKEQLYDFGRLHEFQQKMYARAKDLYSSGEKYRAKEMLAHRRELMKAMNDATKRLDNSSAYEDATKAYAGNMATREAFDKGLEVTKNTKLENHPDFWIDSIKDLSESERAALHAGIRAAIDKVAGTARTQSGATASINRIADIPYTRAKVEAAMGEKGSRLMKFLDDMMEQGETHAHVMGGSPTGRRTMATRYKKPDAPDWSLGTLAGKAKREVVESLLDLPTRRGELAEGSARALTATGVTRDMIVKELVKAGKSRAEAKKISKASADIIAKILRRGTGAPTANEASGKIFGTVSLEALGSGRKVSKALRR